jgi:hypothetical protein
MLSERISELNKDRNYIQFNGEEFMKTDMFNFDVSKFRSDTDFNYEKIIMVDNNLKVLIDMLQRYTLK